MKEHQSSFLFWVKDNPEPYELTKQTVALWSYPLDLSLEAVPACLDGAEMERANRFHFSHHRRRFMVARTLLRLILSKYLNLSPEAIQFEYNKQGKPSLPAPQTLHFNLSHSREQALLAISHQPIGVDLEFFSARPYTGIGEHLFSHQEQNILQHTPLALQPLVFFKIWSQKEAFIKACGLGLAYPTAKIDMPLAENNTLLHDPIHHTQWKMTHFMPNIACCAALCYDPSIETIDYRKLKQVSEL